MTDQESRPMLQETRKLLIFLAGKACLVPSLLACKRRLQVSEGNLGLPCLPAATSPRLEQKTARGT